LLIQVRCKLHIALLRRALRAMQEIHLLGKGRNTDIPRKPPCTDKAGLTGSHEPVIGGVSDIPEAPILLRRRTAPEGESARRISG
jgi:hypothetical protein